MIYFIYGSQEPIIRERIKKITKEVLGNDKDEMNFVKFDGREVLIQDVIDECNYIALGYDKKVVVLEHAYFLLSKKEKNKIESEQNYDSLINYINNPNDQTCFIITINSSELDNKGKIVPLLKNKAEVSEAGEIDKDSWRAYIKRIVTQLLKVEIDNDAIDELYERCEGDIMLFRNHADKLALYTNHITYDDVCLFVPRPLEDNTYAIYNYLITNRNDEAVKLYRDIIATGIEPVTLISTLSKQFRFLYQVSFLTKEGKSQEEIATELAVKSIRVQIAKKQMYNVSEKTILKALDDLYNLDVNIKSGYVDRIYAFELFLINFKAE